MASYAHLTLWETFFMTLIAVVSNFSGIPTIRAVLLDKNTYFEGIIFSMGLVSSLLYHFCQIYEVPVFLQELQWHRLDNVFTITSFQLLTMHLAGILIGESAQLKWSAFMLSIIMQEKDPWNLTYTIVPCVACVFLSIILRIRQRKHIAVHYNMKELRMGGIALLVGLYFFIVGLNEKTDYLRINHGIWHLQAAIFSYYFLNAVRTVPINQEKRTDKDQAPLIVEL